MLAPGATLDDVFGLVPREAVADICRLFRRFEETAGRDWLRRKVTFDPHVWVGNIGASRDVLMGDCLLDLKTTGLPRLDRAWLDQLLLYVLVLGDRAQVRHVGFHLTRQAVTVSWPIEEFMVRASGSPSLDVERLVSAFFTVVVRSSHLPPKERWQAPT